MHEFSMMEPYVLVHICKVAEAHLEWFENRFGIDVKHNESMRLLETQFTSEIGEPDSKPEGAGSTDKAASSTLQVVLWPTPQASGTL